MEKEDIQNYSKSYDGQAYYSSYMYNEKSDFFTFEENYLKNLCENFKENDYSNYSVLDLQGGDGLWGLYLSKLLKAKKCVCVDYTQSMLDVGIKKYKEENMEFYNLSFEDSMSDQRVLKEKYCCVLIKGAIHYSKPIFASQFLEFIKENCTDNSFIIISGFVNNNKFKDIVNVLPETFMNLMNNRSNRPDDFVDELARLDTDKELDIKKDYQKIEYTYPFDEFKAFLEKRSWSGLELCSEDEISNAIEKQRNDTGFVKFSLWSCYILITKKKN